MTYRITKGDLEVTKNVMRALVVKLYIQLEKELPHFEYDRDCPSYNNYQALIDSLVFIENETDLTN